MELTEDLLLGNLERTREVMKQLRQNGIRIAIDDFGQAYSAFNYIGICRSTKSNSITASLLRLPVTRAPPSWRNRSWIWRVRWA